MRPGVWNANVLLLGAASFVADVSGEMLFVVLPSLAVAGGGAGLALGLAGGLSDGVAEVFKLVGGRWSDRARVRKPLVLLGYGIAAVGKVGVAAARGWVVLAGARAFERIGKGIRGAPRDALLAESVPREARGAAFGLHRAMDTAGAVGGVALAFALVSLAGVSPRTIAYVSAGVAAFALLPLLLVRERPLVAPPPTDLRVAFRALPPSFRRFAAFAAVLALGRVTMLFFVFRATQVLPTERALAGAILLYLLFNVVYSATSYPAGRASDVLGRARTVAAGAALFVPCAVGFAYAGGVGSLALLFAALGVSYALVETSLRALAVDEAGGAGKGLALGTLHAVVGVATIVGGVAAGLLWDAAGPEIAFLWCAAVAALALAIGWGNGALRPRLSVT
ncbi:MAG TPA: MFS transporter [Candidatus Thermoplasmatota archaeon]|nr:MFS transporter [Candidatus Thermoplasmatota archaeon]